MTFRVLCFLFLLGSGLIITSCNKKVTHDDYNVILILADDLGYGELGSYGQQKIETPNLDQLASEGIRFTNFYTGAPVCAPSRCIILTGRHSGRAEIRGNDEAGYRGRVWDFLAMEADSSLEGQAPMDTSVQTFPMLLQEHGYSTGVVGKWGLGFPGSVSTPNKKGFDYFYGYNCQRQAHTLTPLHLWENEKRVHLNNDTIVIHSELPSLKDTLSESTYAYLDQPDYAPSLIAQKGIDFVKKNKDEPFFLYWATPLPHVPLQAPKRWIEHYVQKFGDEPPYTGVKGGYFPARYPKATYAAMISYLDENVGRLMATLDSLEISEKTIILFTSDNGATFVRGTDAEWFNSGGPFRSDREWGKGFLREGGIRVPLIVKWPEKVKAGSQTNHLSGAQDLMATILDILDVPNTLEHDGISFKHELLGNKELQNQHDYLYWEFPESGGQRALRWEHWKAYNHSLKSGDTTISIYNLESDIQESEDLSLKFPEKVQFVKDVFRKEHQSSENPRWQYEVLDR